MVEISHYRQLNLMNIFYFRVIKGQIKCGQYNAGAWKDFTPFVVTSVILLET